MDRLKREEDSRNLYLPIKPIDQSKHTLRDAPCGTNQWGSMKLDQRGHSL